MRVYVGRMDLQGGSDSNALRCPRYAISWQPLACSWFQFLSMLVGGSRHNRTVLSVPPERANRPSGVKATLLTVPSWPWNRINSRAVSTFQSLRVLSRLRRERSGRRGRRQPAARTRYAHGSGGAHRLSPGPTVVEFDRPLHRKGAAAIGGEGDAFNPGGMGLESANLLAAREIPQPHRAVAPPDSAKQPSGERATVLTPMV